MPEPRPSILARLLMGGIRLYQILLSPLLGNACRFHPSCSNYGMEALRLHGAFKGSALTVWRILRCQPFSKGGNDPVPLPKHLRPGAGEHPSSS